MNIYDNLPEELKALNWWTFSKNRNNVKQLIGKENSYTDAEKIVRNSEFDIQLGIKVQVPYIFFDIDNVKYANKIYESPLEALSEENDFRLIYERSPTYAEHTISRNGFRVIYKLREDEGNSESRCMFIKNPTRRLFRSIPLNRSGTMRLETLRYGTWSVLTGQRIKYSPNEIAEIEIVALKIMWDNLCIKNIPNYLES